MNKHIKNGKFNILCSKDYNIDFDIPKNCDLIRGNINQSIFNIRQYELDNDEVFSGNLIINKNVDFDIKFIKSLEIDDNSIYVKNYLNSPHANLCSVDESLMYCSSAVLWIISQYDRNEYSFYANLRRNRIVIKRFNDYAKI